MGHILGFSGFMALCFCLVMDLCYVCGGFLGARCPGGEESQSQGWRAQGAGWCVQTGQAGVPPGISITLGALDVPEVLGKLMSCYF